MDSPLLTWLRDQTHDWRPSIVGVFRENADHDNWPLTADSPGDLRVQLADLGHLLPLPSEPAALANVMEIELRRHLMLRVDELGGARIGEGTQRSYPDLEFFGEVFGDGPRAVDIKCARRKLNRSGMPTGSLNNRIALYTGNTYFLWPQLKFSGILRPLDEYADHISVVVLYTYDESRPERITDVKVVRDYRSFDLVAELSEAGFGDVSRFTSKWTRPLTHEEFIELARSSSKLHAAVKHLGEEETTRRLRALLEHHHPSGQLEVPYISELFTAQHHDSLRE